MKLFNSVLKTGAVLALTAAAGFVLTSRASATVSYVYAGDGGSFTYLTPSYIDATRTVPASELTACSTFGATACGRVLFNFPDDNPSVSAIYVYGFDGGGAGTIFLRQDFGADGIYTGLYSPTRTLTVTTLPATGAVPEPATWAMMVGGFGVTGFAMRRRRRAALPLRFA